MNAKNNSCNNMQYVGCNVKDCKYHSPENICRASHINVQNENAQRKSETFCSTFECKSM